jgi:methanogenic corrinoid protein MtbC1
MPEVVAQVIAEHDPMYAINEVLIPALDVVGERFEKGVFFLPQLMASAEAAKAGFETIKAAVDASGQGDNVPEKGSIVVCTVHGDIHDIGKNIVRMLLENYGYNVIDLGRDVPPQVVVDAVVKDHVLLCGLSALMTATVPAMAETIELLRKEAPWCKVVVGGAVLNPEYAEMVGADFYAKDATETARIASEVLGLGHRRSLGGVLDTHSSSECVSTCTRHTFGADCVTRAVIFQVKERAEKNVTRDKCAFLHHAAHGVVPAGHELVHALGVHLAAEHVVRLAQGLKLIDAAPVAR